MYQLAAGEGRLKVSLTAIPVGDDLCVILYGGEKPHIGCVTLSIPRPSLRNSAVTSSTTSILNVIGHKDDEVARHLSHLLASRLNKTVVVTCGIHVDQITADEIQTTIELIAKLTEKLTHYFECCEIEE